MNHEMEMGQNDQAHKMDGMVMKRNLVERGTVPHFEPIVPIAIHLGSDMNIRLSSFSGFEWGHHINEAFAPSMVEKWMNDSAATRATSNRAAGDSPRKSAKLAGGR